MNEVININTALYLFRNKGNMAYEYNPFHNYQTNVDLYEYNGVKFPKGTALNRNNYEILTPYDNKWKDKRGRIVSDVITEEEASLYAAAGSLIDLETDKLNFDINHPVDIQIQPSYDGSVNLIINDDKNIPRLINSRFSVREKNTYEIVDRIGENDTNIYSSNTFDKDTSLYFQYESNPQIKYMGQVNGILPVGQYCFYFTYCDADENESDYIAESGLIPVFIGNDKSPYSMDGGIKNQRTNKGIRLKLSNLDSSYNYIKIYYVRYFADYQQNRVSECKKLYRKYPINSNSVYLQITGNEDVEDIDANILNISRFNPHHLLTSAQCKNMLFFANIVKNVDNYRELTDLALRIIPKIVESKLNPVNIDYSSSENVGYYSSENIYNLTGYFDKEFYRFGVVFIYQNGTLSNVYNTLGLELQSKSTLEYNTGTIYENSDNILLTRKYIKTDDFGWVKDSDTILSGGTYVNGRGVCKFNYGVKYDSQVLGVKFTIPEEVIKYLKEELGIRGLFFVRQKCVPNILAQCMLLPMDETLQAPVLEVKKPDEKSTYYTECFVSQGFNPRYDKKQKKNVKDSDRLVVNNQELRLYQYKDVENDSYISTNAYAAICPDFLLNLPYYNQIFNGSKFKLEKVKDIYLSKSERIYSETETENEDDIYSENAIIGGIYINTVTEAVPTVAIQDKIYRTEIGKAEEVYRFRYAEIDNGSTDTGTKVSGQYDKGNAIEDQASEATNIVRGIYSPYLAIYSNTKLDTSALYNIYQDTYSESNLKQEYQNRMDSSEPFYAIGDRLNFSQLSFSDSNYSSICYRGDCFINTFTYRLNRNFNDPSLPNNDEIIDQYTWKNNYDVTDQTKWEDINRSDINAVQMGSWITFRLRSAMNYALRSEDHSFTSEEALMGTPRSFYPRSFLLFRGENKLPDSYLFNDAFRATLGYKCYFTLQDINYIKDTFSNRIQYSAMAIQDSYKNNYRYSLNTYFRDYSLEYGSITKLVGFEGYLLVVFEHAIGIAVVNERILQGQGDGEPVFINTQNVLPEELTIISDTIGSQWTESVIKTELGYVYGVDTVAKKIWRVKSQQLEILSDFKVNKFLIDNITLGERELNPIIGLKNVKSHYNNNKKDVMFTFYDDIYKDEEKVWNLCFNELMDCFITFYSWVPVASENIDTQFFSFNRNTSKWLSLLHNSNYAISENTGVLVDSPILQLSEDGEYYYTYLHYTAAGFDYNTQLAIDNKITYALEEDHWKNSNYFTIEIITSPLRIKYFKLTAKVSDIDNIIKDRKVLLLYITPKIDSTNDIYNISSSQYFKSETIALTTQNIINGYTEDKQTIYPLSTDFYIHGTSGIIDIKDSIFPCKWYDEQHPFEFEFVVNDRLQQQKIFSNLEIISNKAMPESFHFEIEGDNYDFSNDKRNMYFRQEATKELYQNLGSDVIFDRNYIQVASPNYLFDPFTTKPYEITLVQNPKSTIFPLYYNRIDTFNEIYDNYKLMTSTSRDYANLSGSEISWNKDLNQFNIITHVKNSPIDIIGRTKGNSHYREGIWNIQIPSITFMQKNEEPWNNCFYSNNNYNSSIKSGYNVPPLVLSYIPEDIKKDNILSGDLPNTYEIGQISLDKWTFRKETKIRDKWIKIKVRYSGKELAIIHSLITLYNLSYS